MQIFRTSVQSVVLLTVLSAGFCASAAPTPVDNTTGTLSQGNLPGDFPTTVTAAIMNVEQFVPATLNGTNQNNLKVTFPASGPIKWTESRHNEGDISLLVGPGNPTDTDYFPPNAFADNYGPIANGPYQKSTAAWRLNNDTGAILASVRTNGYNNGNDYTFGGNPVGTIHGVAYMNTSGSGYGYRMNDGQFENGGNRSSDLQMGVGGFNGPSGQGEASFNSAIAYFPYEQGWKGAWVNGADNGEGTYSGSSPGLPTSAVNWTNNQATVALPGVNSATDGMLFVAPTDGDNNTNIAAAFPNAGGWTVSIREDDSATFDGGQPSLVTGGQSSFQFLYVPYSSPRLIGGHVNGTNGSLIQSANDTFFDVARTSAGNYAITVYESDGVTKQNEGDGMLVLSVAGSMPGNPTFADRTFLSYQYEGESGTFIVQSREISAIGQTTPPSENVFGDILSLRDSDFYFAWVSFSNPLAPTLTGDYNNNGVVDAADFAVWRENQGTNTVLPNDPIGGTIGTGQYDQWRANFGSSATISGSGAAIGQLAAAVPEPASLALGALFLGLVGLTRTRR